MMRGNSLEQDLRLLINNQKYSDIEIICEDEKKLYGCRAILAARSEVFDRLLYNGMKESYETQISFPKINSSVMEIILEYTYTGSIKEEFLTKDNMIEAFYAADYFQLTELQNFVMKIFKNTLEKNSTENHSPELLSKFAEYFPLNENNIFLNLSVEAVSIIPLDTIEFGRLSIKGLQYLLSCTYEKKKPFATPEYEVFRYSAILAAKQVSNETYKSLIERLPTLNQLEQLENFVQTDSINKFIINHQKIAKELEPLIKFIDFIRIKGSVLANVIEPLELISANIVTDIYRQKAILNKSDSNDIRGIPMLTYSNYVWDDSECGSKLIIEDNKKVVYAQNDLNSWHNVRAKMLLENNGIFEWDVIVEKVCERVWIGVCSSVNFNYEFFAGNQPTGWVLGNDGSIRNSGKWLNYCPSFGDGTRITVHLDLNKRTCSFTVNGKKYREVSEWNNLPSKLYPVVSLSHSGRSRIQPYLKNA